MINLKEALDMYHGRSWDEVWRDPNSGKEYSYGWGHPGGLEREFEILFGDVKGYQSCTAKERKYETMKNNRYSVVIKNVIFNPPATIVFWDDGDKTVVKCGKDEPFDPEKGLAMAIAKRVLGQRGSYYGQIKKWTKPYNDEAERQ